MKKHFSMFLAVVLILTMAFTLFGCSSSENTNKVNAAFTEYLVAEKVGTVNRDNFTVCDGGLYYRENDKYGVMSYEGLHDTGAIYASCSERKNYFAVSKTEPSNLSNVKEVNVYGLINGKGKVIVPFEYVYFYMLNDRFVQVYQATARTYTDDENVIATFTNYDTNEKAMYKGNWFVYDLTTGKKVPGVSGTTDKIVSAHGNYLSYSTPDNTNYIKVNYKGVALPEGAKLFNDGSYSVEGKVGDVFDSNGNKLFSYDLTGYVPQNIDEGSEYYTASKYVDGASKYVVMDKKGTVVSSEFSDYITIYDKVIECGDQIYNLEGEKIIDGTYQSVYFDEIIGQNWIVRNEEDYTMIDEKGNVYFTGKYDDSYDVNTTDFTANVEKEDAHYYYSFADNAYSIKGNSFAPWLVKVDNANSLYDLVDTMTGKKLLEGYKNYQYAACSPLAYYVYAIYEGGAEVYLIVSGAQLSDVTTKKENLLDDLIAAFEKEGIKVSIDKATGEMALDSSVLFGGDSAVLTADGKTFLNKFIKVYTSIAFSQKYEGFITKTIVEGHTAPVAGSTYASGLQLSEERAENVKAYCLSKDTGIDVSKISKTLEAVGYSNSKPIKNKNGEVDMAASRRVSFRFLVAVEF